MASAATASATVDVPLRTGVAPAAAIAALFARIFALVSVTVNVNAPPVPAVAFAPSAVRPATSVLIVRLKPAAVVTAPSCAICAAVRVITALLSAVIDLTPVNDTPLKSTVLPDAPIATVSSDVVMFPDTEVNPSSTASSIVTFVPVKTRFSMLVNVAPAAPITLPSPEI